MPAFLTCFPRASSTASVSRGGAPHVMPVLPDHERHPDLATMPLGAAARERALRPPFRSGLDQTEVVGIDVLECDRICFVVFEQHGRVVDLDHDELIEIALRVRG